MRIGVFALVFFAALSFTPAAAPQSDKVSVSVSHSGDDSVGKQFAYAVREAVRGSNGFRLVSDDGSGLQVNIVSIDPERTSGSYWTAVAVTYTMANFMPYKKGEPQTWYPIYLTSQVMTIGSRRVEEQAKSVMATLDEVLEKYRRDARK